MEEWESLSVPKREYVLWLAKSISERGEMGCCHAGIAKRSGMIPVAVYGEVPMD